MGTRAAALKNLSKAGKGKGRPKGIKNKFTNLKQAFLDAFVGVGGSEELMRWARDKRNRALFYQMVAKMLPKSVDVNSEGFQLVIKGKNEKV